MASAADYGVSDVVLYPRDGSTTPPRYDGRLVLNLVTWMLVGFSGILAVLRVWCKIKRHRGLWHDDYWLIVSWIFLLAGAIVQAVDSRYGFGTSFYSIDKTLVDDVRLISIVAGWCYIAAVATSKISFAITLLRISTGGARLFIFGVIVSISITFTISLLVQWIQCWPIDILWHQNKKGKCLPLSLTNGYNIFLSTFSATMDIMLAILPWRILWNLTMRRAEKLGVLVAMSMGIFAGVASVLKAVAVHQLFRPHATAEVVVRVMVFGAAEAAVSIMAISIPILRTLFRGESRPMVVESFLPNQWTRASFRSWLPRLDNWRSSRHQPEPWELNAKNKDEDAFSFDDAILKDEKLP